jgi:hypothetical protein
MGVKDSMSSWRLAVVLGSLPICVAACAPATPPSSPRDISSREAMSIFMEAAQRPCADFARAHANQTIAADLMVAGASNGSRVSTRLWLGWDLDAGSLRLEPFQGSPPAFVFIANGLTDDNYDPDQLDGSLILPDRSGAIQQEFSRELLYPLLGVPLSADELAGVMAGCTAFRGSLSGHTLGPDTVRLLFDGDLPAEMVFGRDADVPAGWTLLGMGRSTPGSTSHWRADYGRRVLAVFKDFRIHSREWNGLTTDSFDVSFSWRRIQAGPPLDKQLFVPEAPSPRPGFAR